MKENKLINAIAVLFIVNHLLVIALIATLNKINYFDDKTTKVSLSIISPIFVSFTTIIIRYIIKNKNVTVPLESGVSFLFGFVALFVPIAFLILVYVIIISQAIHADPIEKYCTYMGALETVSGAFTGNIIKSLFEGRQRSGRI